MTRVAPHSVDTATIAAALHELRVHVAVVSLEGGIARGMAILAAWRSKNFVNLQKSRARLARTARDVSSGARVDLDGTVLMRGGERSGYSSRTN
jgi:hypothetical protein